MSTHVVISITVVCFYFSPVTILGLEVAGVKNRNEVFMADMPQKNEHISVDIQAADLSLMSKDCYCNLLSFEI